MLISDTVLKEYLKNCYFITGTAYAGKSTMCKLLAETYGMVHCRENYMLDKARTIITPEEYPNLCYFETMSGWQEWLNRTPEEYERWFDGNCREITDFEIVELIRLSAEKKVIVDTCIPLDILKRITEPNQVAVMLSPKAMSVDYFFEREDEEKQFLLSQIRLAEDPEKTMQNFRNCIALLNSKERYDAMKNSGYFTLIREDVQRDTRQDVLAQLALHFGLASVEVMKLTPGTDRWEETITYAENSTWEGVGKHLADSMRKNAFAPWEAVFICLVDGKIAGYCTFLEYDYYPENRYSPWISTIFVEERYRGHRLSHRMIEAVIDYAREQHFEKVYIPSDMTGFYEKCGFERIDTLTNYGGDIDNVFMRCI